MNTLVQLRAGELTGARQLTLCCGLTTFPPEIFTLADTLEILDLSGNALSALPEDLYRLRKLRVIFCSFNQFNELPRVLGRCAELNMVGFKGNQIQMVTAAALPPKLRWLILTDNQLSALPAEIGDCHALQKLMLAGNQLRSLPASLANCANLELLRIAANQLTELPSCVYHLPRLAWLAYAGNPFCAELENRALTQSELPVIPWEALTVQQQIGAGASGTIYQAQHAAGQAVAVKLFKGELTSDGLPHNEMACCMVAGAHPNLIQLHGKIDAHPSQQTGLVMALIAATFSNLAAPPSFASCTRDCYAADTVFTLEVLLKIARNIASAVAHLHSRGILHGDLYAHNILFDAAGNSLLGDFGAASFLPVEAEKAQALQQIEVRAFGILLQELLSRCATVVEIPLVLSDLASRCRTENISQRPLFNEILNIINCLQ